MGGETKLRMYMQEGTLVTKVTDTCRCMSLIYLEDGLQLEVTEENRLTAGESGNI